MNGRLPTTGYGGAAGPGGGIRAGSMTNEEWAAIRRRLARQHGVHVNAIEDRGLRLTDCSPRTCRAVQDDE